MAIVRRGSGSGKVPRVLVGLIRDHVIDEVPFVTATELLPDLRQLCAEDIIAIGLALYLLVGKDRQAGTNSGLASTWEAAALANSVGRRL